MSNEYKHIFIIITKARTFELKPRLLTVVSVMVPKFIDPFDSITTRNFKQAEKEYKAICAFSTR